jgi:hypothetical protein
MRHGNAGHVAAGVAVWFQNEGETRDQNTEVHEAAHWRRHLQTRASVTFDDQGLGQSQGTGAGYGPGVMLGSGWTSTPHSACDSSHVPGGLVQRWVRPAEQPGRSGGDGELLPRHDVWDPGASGASPDSEMAGLLAAADPHRRDSCREIRTMIASGLSVDRVRVWQSRPCPLKEL